MYLIIKYKNELNNKPKQKQITNKQIASRTRMWKNENGDSNLKWIQWIEKNEVFSYFLQIPQNPLTLIVNNIDNK